MIRTECLYEQLVLRCAPRGHAGLARALGAVRAVCALNDGALLTVGRVLPGATS